MARLKTCGFELNSLTAGVEISEIVNAAAASVVTSPVRTGTYALQVAAIGTSTSVGLIPFSSDQAIVGYQRVYIYVPTGGAPNANANILAFLSTAGTLVGRVVLGATPSLRLHNSSNTLIGSHSAVLSLDTWYRVELGIDATTSPGTLEARLLACPGGVDPGGPGTTFSSGANNIQGSWAKGRVGNISTVTSTIVFDDWAINDSSGANQNSWVERGNTIVLRPNGDGDNHAFLDTAAAAGTANNYTLVDETPPNDATDFVQALTSGNTDMYAMSNSGIASDAVVSVVTVEGRTANITGGASDTAAKYQIEKTTGGTKTQSAAFSPNSTTWRTITGNSTNTGTPPITTYADPDAAAWTQSTLDSMQAGITITTTGASRRIGMTALWVTVEYLTPPIVSLNASAATASPTLGVQAQTGIPFAASAGQSAATLTLTAQRVTHRVATASSVDGSAYTTGSFTPSVNDLLVVFVYASATTGAATATDSQGGTYTAVLQQTLGTTRLYAFIADQLVSAATLTTVTFDCTGDAASGTNIVVESVAGMPRLGASAARQTGFATTGAGNVPQVSLGSSALTANPVFAVVGNSTSPAGLSPPSGWAEQADIGYSTPSTGLEIATLESGFTASTVTWGSSSGSAHIEMVLELDTSVLVPLGASGGSSSGTLVVSATTRITLGVSAASTSATLGASAQTRVPLNASAAQSAATLTASVPAGVPLNASAVSTTASLSVSAQTRIPLGTSAAAASPTLAVKAQTTVALGTSAALSSASLSLAGVAIVPLGTSVGLSTATLTAKAQTQIPLATSVGLSSGTLALSGQTTISLGASAASTSGALAVRAMTTVALGASAGVTTTTATVMVLATVPLGTSAATSSATLAVKAQTQVPLATSTAVASATLALSGQTVIALGTSAVLSVTTLALDVGSTDQFGRPVADIATTGWTTTPLWSKLDEAIADDADKIEGVAA